MISDVRDDFWGYLFEHCGCEWCGKRNERRLKTEDVTSMFGDRPAGRWRESHGARDGDGGNGDGDGDNSDDDSNGARMAKSEIYIYCSCPCHFFTHASTMSLPQKIAFTRIGAAHSPSTLEVYIDPVCPFSRKITESIDKNVLPMITNGGKYDGKVNLVVRLYPQPLCVIL